VFYNSKSRLLLLAGVLTSLCFATALHGQSPPATNDYDALVQALETTTPLPASDAPRFGSFYTIQHGEAWPPLPADTMNLPFWDLGGGYFLLDDTNVDYAALQTESASRGRFSMDDGFEPDFQPQVYTTNDLWLAILGVTNDPTGLTAHLTIHPPWNDTNSTHDLLYSADLNSPTNWRFLMRCLSTNVIARGICEARGFFALTRTNGNLTVSTNSSPLQMAQMLVPPGVTIANATYTGAIVARGTFAGGNACGLPLDTGVIISTGHVTNAIGPNDDSGAIAFVNGSSNLGTDGDADLDNLTAGGPTYDAAVLEFDVVSTNSFNLEFQYIFASEEYPEWIGPYNDPMAIFVSTNRAATNWVNNITNDLALVPGSTNLPVSVNTINGGCAADAYNQSIPATNPQYYVDNHDPRYLAAAPYSVTAPAFNIQYDGMTVLLTAQTLIFACVTNHVKIAIADYGDANWDSAVFITAKTNCP
jgi:hypothetical protein